MTRHESRQAVMMLLYERAARKNESAEDVYVLSLTLRDIEENDYIKTVYFGVQEHGEELDAKISDAAVDWSLDRMSRVTLAILRLAAYELYYERGIPTNVTINEAVELAKEYDEGAASAFINGILSKMSADTSIVKDVVPRGAKK